MKILEVQLNNIKSYSEQTVRFEHGTNCICGENGAGKTTIVEAIGWALFDSLPYNQKQFKRDGAVSAAVSVIFQARDGREYEVVRKIGGSGPHWYVFDIEIRDRAAEGASDVKAWLARNLGLDDASDPQVLFENAVGVPQGGLTAPFLQSPERRKQCFDPILRVHEFAVAFTQLRETGSYLENKVRDQRELAATHGVEADRIPVLTQAMLQVHESVARAEGSLHDRRKEKARQDSRVAALEAEELRLASLRQNLELREQAIESARADYEQATARVEQAWRAHEIVERSFVGYKLFRDAESQFGELQPRYDEYRRLRTEHQGVERELQRLARDLETRRREIERAEATAAQLPELQQRADEAAQLGKELHALEQLARQLPKLESDLRREITGSKELKQEICRLEAEIQRTESLQEKAAAVGNLREQCQELLLQMREAERAQAQTTKLRRDLADLETKISLTRTEMQGLASRLAVAPDLEKQATLLPGFKEAEEKAREEYDALRMQHATVKAQKEARTVECPLSRADCLAIQNDPRRDQKIDAELARIVAEGLKAKATLDKTKSAKAEAERASTDWQSIQGVRIQREAAEQRLQELETRRADLHAETALRQGLLSQSQELQEKHRTMQVQLDAAESAQRDVHRLADLHAARQRQAEALARQEETEARLRRELAESRKQAEQAKDLQARLQVLGDATNEYAEARAVASTLAQLREAERLTLEMCETETQKGTELKRELSKLSSVEADVQRAQTTITEHKEAYEAYLSSHTLAEELVERQVRQKQVEADLQRKLVEREKQRALLEQALQSWDEVALQGARTTVSELSREIGILTATIDSETKHLDDLRVELERCEGHAVEREKALAEAARLEELQELLGFARRTIKDAQGPVTEALLLGVSQEARSLFSDIVEDHSARLTWTPDYEIQLERGTERLVFGQMSGGEQMSAALAVRLALLKTLSDIDVAFLDEPTQNMDETRRSNLASQVRDVKGFSQLFVISHDDTFERQVSHAVVVRKDGGESIVTYGHEE